MKKRDLEKKAASLGWWLDGHGNKHDKWTNGYMFEMIPRHNEINELLAKKILNTMRSNPPKEK